jgi:LysR family transcriptional regulator, transcription activator of glutamate synthase operon
MELRQLRYLVALADEQHFTRAAAREHIAQPALSQQIRRLEQEVGLALVERTTRKVTVTEAGKTLVARARRILSEVDAANAEMQALAGVRAGHVSVGTMHTMGPVDVSHALAVFHERHPSVELTVREQSSEELAEMLRDDVLDLAFLSVTERIETQGLVLRQLVSEDLVVVLPSDHPLATRRRLRMAELADEQFVSYREGARLRELLIYAAHRAGFEPQIKLESNESERIRRLVARGMGVAILPQSDADRSAGHLAVAALIEPSLRRDITLACREGRRLSPAAAEFLDLSKDLFRSKAAGSAPTAAPSRAVRRASRADPQPPAGRRAGC